MRPRLLRLLPVLVACCAVTVLLWVNTAVGANAAPMSQETPPADTPLSPQQLEQFWKGLYPDQVESADHTPPVFVSELLAKAAPDECYNGIGVPYTGTLPDCSDVPDSQPKVNQAYVWGLTPYSSTTDNTLWFGTAPNVHCLVIGGFLGATSPIETESYVCEFGASQIAQTTAITDRIGDWRPSDLFVYDVLADTLTEVTPPSLLLYSTLGIRSAGTFGKYVFFGGPSLLGGINLFLFDAETRTFIAGGNVPGYTNIRKWLEVDGVLYLGVGKPGGGAVLRYTGDPTSANPVVRFAFTEVGTLDGDAAELALHDGRLFVNTWPALSLSGTITDFFSSAVAGLWMSPVLDGDGLNPADAGVWQKVFSYDEYEPDPVIARTYGGGALMSYGGDLFWGTMHVPFLSTLAHIGVYQEAYALNGGLDQEAALAAILATQRAISIFQGRNFGTVDQAVEVAYGLDQLPTFDPISATWTLEYNGIDVPKYGLAGINNLFNNYTWSMAVHDDQLFIGTMDWSYLLGDLLQTFLNEVVLPPEIVVNLPMATSGADLVAFVDPQLPALPVSLNGVGNYTNYGVRNMVSDASGVYLGMANPMNLLTDPFDDKPEGGWELLHLSHVMVPIQVNVVGTGSGTVTSIPPGLDCTDSCFAEFKFGEEVFLTATPDVGSTFTGWEGSCTGDGVCGGYLLTPKAVAAVFTLNTYTVTVAKAGDGAGSVTSTPAGIDCGSDCSEVYDYGTSVELSYTAAAGSIFNGWSGACTGMAACIVDVTETKNVTATFLNNIFPLTVVVTGTGSGVVSSVANGIDCSQGSCSSDLEAGTQVTLSAVAAQGSSFTGWSGACTGATCSVEVEPGGSTVTATFTLDPQQASIQVEGTLEPGQPISLTAILPISPILECTWDFGDGQSESCAEVSALGAETVNDVTVQTTHVYTEVNTYIVTVTASNEAGVVSASRVINLLAPTAEQPVAAPDARHGVYLPLMVR